MSVWGREFGRFASDPLEALPADPQNISGKRKGQEA